MSSTDAVRNDTHAEQLVRRILVPTDLSPIADHALEYALELARRMHATVDVLTVLGQVEGDVFNPIRYSPEASVRDRSSRAILREMLADLLGRHDTSGVALTSSVHRGRPLSTILNVAKRTRADLLVVGTHDRSPLHHFLVGSMADELVRRAAASVLVIHERDGKTPSEVERVLVPVDLSSSTAGVLRYGAMTANLFGARLEIVHVVETMPLLDTFTGVMTIRDMVPEMKRQIAVELGERVEAAGLGERAERVFVEEGHAAARIIEIARTDHCDLIVVGRQGRSAIEHFFIGSVTERVVRHAPCPVLVAASDVIGRWSGESDDLRRGENAAADAAP